MSCCKPYNPCVSNNGSYASTAGQYATDAAKSAANAAASATQASTAEANAKEYAIEAAQSAAISGIYLGAKATAPTLDNQGNPLEVGMQYFNTVDNTMYVWDGTSWISASAFNETTPFLATGTTTNRDLQERFADVVNVLDFGADPTGATDSTSAFVAAVAACKANGIRRLTLAGRNYLLTQRITIDFSDFTIDGEGATITWAGAGLDSLDTGVFQFRGTQSAVTTTVSTDAAEYTSSLVVANASGFDVGDIVQIDSASVAPPGLYVNVTTRISDILGTTFSTDVTRRLALTSSEAVSVTKLNAVERSGIENCNFIATGQTSRANGMGGVHFQYTASCFAKNCSFVGFWFKGVKSQFSLNMLASGIYCRNPSAVGGGEGYALQYEYVYNSVAERITGVQCRHTIDFTASWHIVASDCFDSDAKGGSYTLHSAYEYDIVFDKCVSISNTTEAAFALGSVGVFGSTTDQITISNCSVVDFDSSQAIAFRSKGQGLRISNTLVQLKTGAVGAAIAVGNANVTIDNCQIFGGILTAADVANGAYNSGDILVNNCVLVAQANQRSLNLLNGYRIHLSNSTVDGLVQADSGFLYAENCRFVIQGDNYQYISFTSATADNGSYYFNNCQFDPSVALLAAREFYGSLNSFVGCSFGQDPNGQPFRPQSTNVVFTNNTGQMRFQVLSPVANCIFSNNILSGVNAGASRIFDASGFTGKLIAIGNVLQQDTDTTNCFIVASSNLIESCVFANNSIKGIVILTNAEITNANVTGNIVDGTATYPTAGVQKVVANNVVY